MEQQQGESEVVALLKDVIKRITYLEKKVDVLVEQAKERAARSRSFAPGARPPRLSAPKRYPDKREGSFARSASPDRPFEKKSSDDDRGFSSGKPSFKAKPKSKFAGKVKVKHAKRRSAK